MAIPIVMPKRVLSQRIRTVEAALNAAVASSDTSSDALMEVPSTPYSSARETGSVEQLQQDTFL